GSRPRRTKCTLRSSTSSSTSAEPGESASAAPGSASTSSSGSSTWPRFSAVTWSPPGLRVEGLAQRLTEQGEAERSDGDAGAGQQGQVRVALQPVLRLDQHPAPL